jgi:hypothetical protein
MAQKKSLKKRMKKKINKKSMRKTKSRKVKLFRGGKCGCSGGDGLQPAQPSDLKMVGGYGPASFQPIPLRSFYDYNNSSVDNPINDRNTPIHSTTPILMGGKKSRKNRKIKIMHGGNILPQWATQDPILGNNNNIVEYTYTTPGVFTGNNLLNGQGYSYPNINDGPLLYPDRTNII